MRDMRTGKAIAVTRNETFRGDAFALLGLLFSVWGSYRRGVGDARFSGSLRKEQPIARSAGGNKEPEHDDTTRS
jgi:hypothetical protein